MVKGERYTFRHKKHLHLDGETNYTEKDVWKNRNHEEVPQKPTKTWFSTLPNSAAVFPGGKKKNPGRRKKRKKKKIVSG